VVYLLRILAKIIFIGGPSAAPAHSFARAKEKCYEDGPVRKAARSHAG
ncbi:uncharacterized protein METZ01_LOCUS497202, partial [marine metagenome]